MKKIAITVLAVTLALSLGTASALAIGAGQYFTDANSDGICDNAGTHQGQKGGNFIDLDGDGICDNAGQGAKLGQNKH